ncbi:MAG TPA: carboxypeptidase-like regulatory domain-containing protein [Blastocatellia bacterium]|nr:carboxypeptidase-like regulatory domain-containing protein [Blastocatellia bacterium]
MYRKLTKIIVLLLVLGFGQNLAAQTITGRISGTVTDSTGAAVPGVTVKITNEATQQARTSMTDPNGFYVATNLPVGNYTLTVEHQGFKKTAKTGYNLVADGRLSVDFALETGAVTESVEIVAATGEAVNSVSGEVARTVDQSQVQELALNGRNYLQLTTLIPGAPLLEDNALSLTTSLSVSQPINGNRGNANNLTVDGGFNLDSGSNGSQINNVGIDFIREVSIKTSNFSAEYGRNSGASINVVTRSGENKFHGGAFENLRNDKLDANNTFNVARGIKADGTPAVPRPALRFNNFGANFGGPIIKDKLFIFGGVEWKIIRQFTNSQTQTLPTSAELRGDFSARSTVFLKDPLKTGTCSSTVQTACFDNPKIIPANRITADGKAIAAVYAAMAQRAVSFIDTPTSNNALYQEPNPFHSREDLVRIDYRINSAHNVYGRYIHDKYDLIDPFGTFINSALPTIPTNRLRPGYSYQVGHTWMIRPTLINEAKINAAWNGQRVPPVGEFWKRSTYGFTFQQLWTNGGRYENGIPNVSITNFASFVGPSASLLSPTTDISVSDSITWVKGAHTLKTGAVFIRNRKDQNGRPNYTGAVSFNPSGNTLTTSNAFADALLGNFRTYTETDSDPVAFFRFSQYDAYATDSYKLNRKLSLEFGVRYQYGLPTYAQQNNMANFDPSRYDPTKAVTVKADGTIDTTKGGNPYNGLVRVGSGVPQDELGRVPNGNSATVLSVPAGAPRGVYNPQHLFAPRFSFAYAPFNDSKTAVRGGFGIFYDKPEGNLIFSAVNVPPFISSAALENGNLASLVSAKASAPTPFANIDSIDPNLKIAYTMSYSLSVQREMPWGVFVEASYVGNQGRHLLRQPDVNQPTFEAQRANLALPTAQRLSTNALRPYKGFSQIRMRLSDSTSNYNSLQLYAAKRKGNVTMTGSYTWSHALTDSSSNTDNLEDPGARRYNYGPATFDRRHIFVATYTYRMPFFNKLKSKSVAGNLLKGWEVSGITRFQSGQFYTPVANTTIGSRRADYLGGDIALADDVRNQAKWFNTAAFGPAPEDRRGNARVGSILGPGRNLWDLSLRKQFTLHEQYKLQFRGDMFNAFNHVNLNLNNGGLIVNQAANNYGTITNAAPGRQVQLGLRLTF